MAYNNNKAKRNKVRIYDLLENNINKIKKVKSYNNNRGVTVATSYFNLVNKITADKIIADIGIINL